MNANDPGARLRAAAEAGGLVTYSYDDASRLQAILRGASVFGFEYDDANRRTRLTYPNGVATTYGYDNLNRLTSIQAVLNGATTVTSFGYTYDAAGNRLTKILPEFTETYAYDPLYRLIGVDRTGTQTGLWRYAYDGVGNRTSAQTNSAVLESTYNERNQLLSSGTGGQMLWRGTLDEPGNVQFTSALANGQPARMLPGNVFEATLDMQPGTNAVQLRATDVNGNVTTKNYEVDVTGTGASYTYDPNGNLTSKTEGSDVWGYEWNANNELTRVLKNGVEQARFAYDPLGRRVEKVAGGVTTSYTSDGSNLLREVRAGTTLTYVFGQLLDEPLAVSAGASTSYFHLDGLRSQVKATDPSGTVTSVRQYDAWGNLELGGTEGVYAFGGREWDPEVGLYYNRARYYDPKAGRFSREDPIRQTNGNLYPYVADNPIGYIDPFGNEPISMVLGGIAGATLPAWAGPAAVAVTGAAAIAAAWGIGENLADALYPPPVPPMPTPVPPSGGDATTTASPLPPTTALPPLPPLPPTTTLDPPAPPLCPAKKKPGCYCKCFTEGLMGPPIGRVDNPAACSSICASKGWSGSSCR